MTASTIGPRRWIDDFASQEVHAGATKLAWKLLDDPVAEMPDQGRPCVFCPRVRP